MGKFDGILIASDWDNTIFHNGKISEENIEAIRYFQKNGGLFTICSGRFSDFLESYSSSITPNTYLICCNGAFIIETQSRELFYQGFCDEYIFDIIDYLLKNQTSFTNIRFFSTEKEPLLVINTREEYEARKAFLKNLSIYKVVFTYPEENFAISDKIYLNEGNILRDYIAVRSWKTGLEIFKKENGKGVAIRRIADKVGAKLTVGVGDYENDLELIKAADIGYAVENATNELKAVADRITVSCENNAIAHIIYELEEEIDNQ